MVSLPPDMWAELYYDGAWNPLSPGLRQHSTVTISRGLSAESASAAEPTALGCDLDSRDHTYAPRNPRSRLFRKIGPNSPFRFGYEVGSPWAQMPGATGSKLTTPDAASLAVTDLDLRIEAALEDWGVQCELAGRYQLSGDNRSWALTMAGTGQLQFLWSPDGTLASRIAQFSTESLVAYNGQRLALRVTLDVNNGAGGYELRFYTGRTVDDEEWNLLGDPITGAATTAVFDGAAGIELGEIAGLADAGMTGKLFAFKLLSGIAGTVACSMTTADAAPGAASFTSGGVVWTVTGSASLTNKHIRMAGEVPAWPPTRDLSGNDTYVSITPTGITRRMDAGNKPQDSALLRFLKANDPVECWPLTDGTASTSGKSLVGGTDIVQRLLSGDTRVSWGAGSLAEWIEPVMSVAPDITASLYGSCRSTAGTDAAWSVDLFLSGGGTPSSGQFTIYDRGAKTDTDNQVSIELIFTGSLDRLSVIRHSEGETTSSTALLQNIDTTGIYTESPHHIRLSIDPGATDTLWAVYIDGELAGNGTISGIVMKSVSNFFLGLGYATLAGVTMTARSFGFLTYWDGSGPTAAEMYAAYLGFQGEGAGTRIERIAAEAGYVASASGETSFQEPMGIQGRKKLLELLNEANRTAFGYLLEARDRNELIHRGHSTLWNQPPALTLDFSAGLISAPFRPADDERLRENDVSVKREYGAVPARQVLEEGELSVQDFPDGAGRYDNEYTYSLYTDAQAAHVASMRVHLGTYNGVRYTRITLNLANPRVHQMIDDILRVDCGDLLRLTDLPEDHGPDDVDVLVQGYTEEAGPDTWTITFNCVPAQPWTALVLGSTAYGRLDTGGCQLAEDLDETETAVDVTTTGLRRWIDSATFPTHFPFDIRVGGAGGEVMRVTACTGTTTSQTFTVTRAINGVATTHSTGDDVRLATPVYLAL